MFHASGTVLRGAIPDILSIDMDSVRDAVPAPLASTPQFLSYEDLNSMFCDLSYDELYASVGTFRVVTLTTAHTLSSAESFSYYVLSGQVKVQTNTSTFTLSANQFCSVAGNSGTLFTPSPSSTDFFAITTPFTPPVYYDDSVRMVVYRNGYCYLRWFEFSTDLDFLYSFAIMRGPDPPIAAIHAHLLTDPSVPEGYEIEKPMFLNGRYHLNGQGEKVPLKDIVFDHPWAPIGNDSYDDNLLTSSEMAALTSCTVRIDPYSDKIFSMIGMDTDEAKSNAIKMMYADKNSRLRTAIDQNIANKISDNCMDKVKKRKVHINQSMSPDQERRLETAYPEFQLIFASKSLQSHPMAAACRKLETELILSNFNYSLESRPTKGYRACIVDIGGNWSSHMISKRKYIHSCCPILDAYDDLRLNVRRDMVNSYVIPQGDERRKEIFATYRDRKTRCRILCYRRAEECQVRAPHMMAIHSLYNMDHQAIAEAMLSHGAAVLAGTMIFVPEIFIGLNGTIADLGCDYRIDAKRDEIEFSFRNDASYNYVHKLSSYKRFFTQMSFTNKDGRHTFYTQLGTNRLGVQFFTIHRTGGSAIPRSLIRHKLHFQTMADKVVVKYYDFDVKATTARVAMRPCVFFAPRALYQKILMWALRFPDAKFSVFETFNYACSVNNRQVHGGVSITTNEGVDPTTLMKLSHAVYLQAYTQRYNMGRVDKNVIESIKADRALSENGIVKQVIMIIKGGLRTIWPSGKLSSLLALWVLNPDHFDVDIRDAVTVQTFDQWVEHEEIILQTDPYNYLVDSDATNISADVEFDRVEETDPETGEKTYKMVVRAVENPIRQPYVEPAEPDIDTVYCAYAATSMLRELSDITDNARKISDENVHYFSTEEAACLEAKKMLKAFPNVNVAKLIEPTLQNFSRDVDEPARLVCCASLEQQKVQRLELLKSLHATSNGDAHFEMGKDIDMKIPAIKMKKHHIPIVNKTIDLPTPYMEPIARCANINPTLVREVDGEEECIPAIDIKRTQESMKQAIESGKTSLAEKIKKSWKSVLGKPDPDDEEVVLFDAAAVPGSPASSTEDFWNEGSWENLLQEPKPKENSLPLVEIAVAAEESVQEQVVEESVVESPEKNEPPPVDAVPEAADEENAEPMSAEDWVSANEQVERDITELAEDRVRTSEEIVSDEPIEETPIDMEKHFDNDISVLVEEVRSSLLPTETIQASDEGNAKGKEEEREMTTNAVAFISVGGADKCDQEKEEQSGATNAVFPTDVIDGVSFSCQKTSSWSVSVSACSDRFALEKCRCENHIMTHVPSDGACFYWSMAHLLNKRGEADVRYDVLTSELPSEFADKAKEVAKHKGKWADENVINFTAQVYNVKLCIHEFDESLADNCKVVNPKGTKKLCLAQTAVHISPLNCIRVEKASSVATPEKRKENGSDDDVAGKRPDGADKSSPPANTTKDGNDSNPDKGRCPDLVTPKMLTLNRTLIATGHVAGPMTRDKSAMSPIERVLWADFQPAFVKSNKVNTNATAEQLNAAIEVLEYWRIYTQRLQNEISDVLLRFNPDLPVDIKAMSMSSKGVGIYDMANKKWLVKPPKGEVYSWGHDGANLIKIPRCIFRAKDDESAEEEDGDAGVRFDTFYQNWLDRGAARPKFIYTDSDFRLMQETKLYMRLYPHGYLKGIRPDLKFEFVNGVPGCGKTTYILREHKKSVYTNVGSRRVLVEKGDLVLTNTREGAVDIRKRLAAMGLPNDKTQYRTIDSYLLNSEEQWDTVYFDEALMSHFGVIMMVCSLARCTKAVLIGDRNQIPFIGRLTGVRLVYADASKYVKITRELNVSYRCPVDVAVSLSKLYPGGMKSASCVRNSMSFKKINQLLDVPKRDEVQYLTFKQQEKREMLQKGYLKVKTVHEFQGNQADVVYVVRLSSKEKDQLYNRPEHVTVALSRHRQQLVYYAPIMVDELHRRTAKTYEARDMQLATTEFDVPYSKILVGGSPECLMQPDTAIRQIRMPVDPTLQVWYDSLLPEDSTEDQSADHAQVLTSDVCFNIGYHETKAGKLGPIKDLRPTLVPRLRTGAAPPRQKAMRETVLAFAKRNANVPELSGVAHTRREVEIIVDLFKKAYLIDAEYMLRGYKESPLIPNSVAVEDWLKLQPPAVAKQIVGDATAVWDKPLNEYAFMNKREVKPALDGTAAKEYKPSQTIAYPTKDINAIFSPIFREATTRLKAILKPHVLLFCGDSLSTFADKISDICPPTLAKGLYPKEIDFSKYDKSQGELHLRLEMALFEMLGMPPDYLVYWYAAHYYTQVSDYSIGFKAWLLYQRKSGDAATFFGNTLICMSIMASLYEMEKAELALFAGDDSLILGPQPLFEKDMEYDAATLFNMESKFFNYKSLYFCSKFIVPVGDKWVIVPDPLKVVFKLGRYDLVDWEHAIEYWTSLQDLLKPFTDAGLNEPLSEAINERYKSDTVDHTLIFGALATLIEDKAEFLSLFEAPPGGLLRDPSRPKLDF